MDENSNIIKQQTTKLIEILPLALTMYEMTNALKEIFVLISVPKIEILQIKVVLLQCEA